MRYRPFGRTGLEVSEVGFGAWAIGGQGYGAVDRAEALRALAVAEELGCTLIDTAGVYGDSEGIIGEFLSGRRDRWLVATKYSGQEQGLTKTIEDQLRRLRLDTIDFYQLHWTPRDRDDLYEQLHRLRADGKIRFIGVSLYAVEEIDYALGRGDLDGFQVACSLLDPEPLLPRRDAVRARGLGVLVRSSLKSGFLAGKFASDTRFPDPADQRARWSPRQVAETVAAAERFRFLEANGRSLLAAAVRYPLAFPEVSTVLLGTKTAAQARVNFGEVPGPGLDGATLEAIRSVQRSLGLFDRQPRAYWGAAVRLMRRLLGR
jgi:aryl-alcohol dehydrogenase-like predicted oxidoreductase